MKSKKKKPRRRYTEEFKREAVRLVETWGERTIADVAAGRVVLSREIAVARAARDGLRRRTELIRLARYGANVPDRPVIEAMRVVVGVFVS